MGKQQSVESELTVRDQWSVDTVMAIIEKAQSDGSYDRVTRQTDVDLTELLQRLEASKTAEERRYTVVRDYPGIFFLVAMSLGEDISKVMEEAKDLHEDLRTMGLWIQWWLLPHFEMLHQQGELKKVTKEMEIYGEQCKYDGYVNKAGKIYGVGTAITAELN